MTSWIYQELITFIQEDPDWWSEITKTNLDITTHRSILTTVNQTPTAVCVFSPERSKFTSQPLTEADQQQVFFFFFFKVRRTPTSGRWKHELFKLLLYSSSVCDTWPLTPPLFFIVVLVYVPWRISRLPSTFQPVCPWRAAERRRGAPPLSSRTSACGSEFRARLLLCFQLDMQMNSQIQFDANLILIWQNRLLSSAFSREIELLLFSRFKPSVIFILIVFSLSCFNVSVL